MAAPQIDDHLLGEELETNRVVSARVARPLKGSDGAYHAHRLFVTSLGDQPELAKRFEAVARSTSQIRHRNVAEVIAFGLDGRQPYLIIAPGPAQSLRKLLQESEGGRLNPTQVALIGKDIASALEATTAATPTPHLGLMPESILVDSSGHAVLADFGITDLLSEGEAERSQMLSETAAYESPEGMVGDAGPPADIFSLCACLYEALTGRRPFTGDTPYQVVIKIKLGKVDRLEDSGLSIPEELVSLIHRGLSSAPASRPTAGELVSGLGALTRQAGDARTALGALTLRLLTQKGDDEATLPPDPTPAAETLGLASYALSSPGVPTEEDEESGQTFRRVGRSADTTSPISPLAGAPGGGAGADGADGDVTIMHITPPKPSPEPYPEPDPRAFPNLAALPTPTVASPSDYGPGFSPHDLPGAGPLAPAPQPSPYTLSEQSAERTLPVHDTRAAFDTQGHSASPMHAPYGTGSHALPPEPAHAPVPSYPSHPQVARPQPTPRHAPQPTLQQAPRPALQHTPRTASPTTPQHAPMPPIAPPRTKDPAPAPPISKQPAIISLGPIQLNDRHLLLLVGGILALVLFAFLILVVLVLAT